MSKNTTFLGKLRIPYASRLEFVISITLACLNLVIFAILSQFFPDITPAFFAVGLTLVYLAEITVLAFLRSSQAKMLHRRSIHDLLAEESSVIIKNSLSPIIAIDLETCPI